MGVAVLATVFSAHGSDATPQAFSDGVVAALPVGAGVLGLGAVIALFVPGLRLRRAPTAPATAVEVLVTAPAAR